MRSCCLKTRSWSTIKEVKVTSDRDYLIDLLYTWVPPCKLTIALVSLVVIYLDPSSPLPFLSFPGGDGDLGREYDFGGIGQDSVQLSCLLC